MIREADAFHFRPVETRRARIRIAIEAQRLRAQLVRANPDYVGLHRWTWIRNMRSRRLTGVLLTESCQRGALLRRGLQCRRKAGSGGRL